MLKLFENITGVLIFLNTLYFSGITALPNFCLVEVATTLSVMNSHRRRRSSPLEAKRTFERLQQADVKHRRCRVVDVITTGARRRNNEHLQLQPHQQSTSHLPRLSAANEPRMSLAL